jgi:hypothetical protein
MRYKANGSADMTDLPLVRACASLCEPVNQRGPGFVGDSGERRKPHPVQEIELNATSPMALPFVNNPGADDGDAQAR